jgi:1-pyrroline-5-carboxylate dehydrogenase
MLKPFFPEKYVDFGDPEIQAKQKEALEQVKAEFGEKLPLRIGTERIQTEKRIKSLNPSNTEEVVGDVASASQADAEKAMDAATKAFETWKYVAPETRARYLLRAAELMRQRRYYFNAIMIYECGKSWPEADADTAEAIDFMEFYARQMMEMANGQPLTYSPLDEENNVEYIPLGVTVVIPPWNFPNAIMTGMTTAAIVAGNTVVLKPSSDSPVMAYRLAQLLEEVGLPEGVLNFCPGSGSEIGDYLVDHPKTRMIAFTGSMEVGLRINERAAKVNEGQIWIKRVIAEMGGKDYIVVDEDADLEAAAKGIVTSAFGYQGQKCSACSRAIIVESVYDEVLDRCIELTKEINMGPVDDVKNGFGPVVSQSAFNSIKEYIEIGKKEGKLEIGGGTPDPKGYFIEPTIISGVDENATIAQEEIFGPVVAFIKAKDFDDGLRISNNTIYGLTGAFYTRDQLKLEKARREAHTGNLYLNRKCTGAIVDVHPFGGFNMSGTDSKAGGRDYLLLFTQAKTTTQYLGR